MKQFRHLEKINKELEQENEQLKKALNVKNIIIKDALRSIEILKSQIEGK